MQPYLLVSLIGLPVMFCTLFLSDKSELSRSAAVPNWMLGGADAIAAEDSSVEALGYQTAPEAESSSSATRHARFSTCHSGGGHNCVVDGDTFWNEGQKIRIANIDTPETHPAHCAAESDLGHRATQRLRELLNQGSFTLAPIDRDTDKYGRRLRIVERDGSSLGEVLVSEGLARSYSGGIRES